MQIIKLLVSISFYFSVYLQKIINNEHCVRPRGVHLQQKMRYAYE